MNKLIISFFNKVFSKKIKKQFHHVKEEISHNEKIVYFAEAKHYKNNLAINGWLFLTEENLIFISNQFNFNYNHEKRIALKNVIESLPSEKAKLSTSGLVVTSQRYHVDNYIVDNRDSWIDKINKAKKILEMKR